MYFTPRYASILAALLTTLLAACGSDSKGGDPLNMPVVLSATEYFDDGEESASSRVLYKYNEPAHIRSNISTAGSDGIWNTTDDTSVPFLECAYIPDDTRLPRQRYLPLQAYLRTPSGALVLEATNQPNGEIMRCPSLAGHRLSKEARCAEAACPFATWFGPSYRFDITRAEIGDTITETQSYSAYNLGIHEPLLDQAQETLIIVDTEERPVQVEVNLITRTVFDDILLNLCKPSDNISIEQMLFRSCKLSKETVRYTYQEKTVLREVDYYNDSFFSHTEHSSRVLDLDAGTLTITIDRTLSTGADHPFSLIYHFNNRQQITAEFLLDSGSDDLLDTADDILTERVTHHYRGDGQPLQTLYPESDRRTDYRYDEFGRLIHKEIYSSNTTQPNQRVDIRYNQAHKISETHYSLSSETDSTLVKTKTVYFRAKPDGFSMNFDVEGIQNARIPTVRTVLETFDLR